MDMEDRKTYLEQRARCLQSQLQIVEVRQAELTDELNHVIRELRALDGNKQH